MFHNFRLFNLKLHSRLICSHTVITSVILASAIFSGCRKENRWYSNSGAVWNTTYNITYDAPRDLRDSIQRVFREIDASLSPFSQSSLITRINNNDPTALADHHFRRVFEISQKVNRGSRNLFDPTVSPLVNLWKFGYTGKVSADSIYEPTRPQIDSALAYVGLPDCSISPEGRVLKKSPGTTFNFSGVAKGYACDRVADMLRRNGSSNMMIEIGGEVVIHGHSPRNDNWRLQIDSPMTSAGTPDHKALELLELTECGVATSGNYRNYHRSNRGRVGHTIDPVTGNPRMSEILSATVIAPDCALADAWATAVMAATDVASADSMIRAAGLTALIVTADTIPGQYCVFRILPARN